MDWISTPSTISSPLNGVRAFDGASILRVAESPIVRIRMLCVSALQNRGNVDLWTQWPWLLASAMRPFRTRALGNARRLSRR